MNTSLNYLRSNALTKGSTMKWLVMLALILTPPSLHAQSEIGINPEFASSELLLQRGVAGSPGSVSDFIEMMEIMPLADGSKPILESVRKIGSVYTFYYWNIRELQCTWLFTWNNYKCIW